MSRDDFSPSGRWAGRWALTVIAVVLCTACGGGRTINPFTGETPNDGLESRIRIEVQNLNFNDVTVYAMRSSQPIRVGRVTGKTDGVFNVNWNVAQTMAFRIDVVGGRSCRTGEIIVEQESRVWVSIPSDMGFGVCRAGRR